MFRSACALVVFLSLGSIVQADITFEEFRYGSNADGFVFTPNLTIETPPSTDGTIMSAPDVDGVSTTSFDTAIEEVGNEWVVSSSFSADRPIDVIQSSIESALYFSVDGLAPWTFEFEMSVNWPPITLQDPTITRFGLTIARIEDRGNGIDSFEFFEAGLDDATQTFSASGTLLPNRDYEFVFLFWNSSAFEEINGVEVGHAAFVDGSYTLTLTPPPIPEPSSMALLGVGTIGLIGAARRRTS